MRDPSVDRNRFQKIKKKIKKSIIELNIEEKEHLQAVALKYDLNKDKAPQIVAIGEGHIAKSILTLAEENKIPMYEDESLSALLSKLNLNRQIPKNLFPMVAEILAIIFQMDKNARKRLNIRKKFAKI